MHLVDGPRAGQDTRAGVRNAEDLQQLLHRAVLAAAAVQGHEGGVGALVAKPADEVAAHVDAHHVVPSRSSASSTLRSERSDTWRSSERPPLRTATRLMRRPAGAAAAPARAARPGARPRRRAPPGARLSSTGDRPAHLAGQRAVQLHLLLDHLADPPDALAHAVLAGGRRSSGASSCAPRPSRNAPAPGTNATLSRSARASRSLVSMKSGSVAQMKSPPPGRVHSACAREVVGRGRPAWRRGERGRSR